jgi:hypothetical protein
MLELDLGVRREKAGRGEINGREREEFKAEKFNAD